GADRDLLRVHLLPRDRRDLVPRDLDRAPALAGRCRPDPPGSDGRRRRLRAHRRLRLRPADGLPRRQTAAPESVLLMAAFEEHVRRALDALPPELARGLKNVAVVVGDENSGDPGLLGLCEEAPY